jgi:hypothetical protein
MHWATFWATFSQTHLVTLGLTLSPCSGDTGATVLKKRHLGPKIYLTAATHFLPNFQSSFEVDVKRGKKSDRKRSLKIN